MCDGDSGGGMFLMRGGQFYIRGITSVAVTQKTTSGGARQCDPDQYFLFTDVANHYYWITRNLISLSDPIQFS